MNRMGREESDARPTAYVPAYRLRVQNGPEAGREFTLPTLPCCLGRGGRSQVVLEDTANPPCLSREHVTLTLHGRDLLVTDHSRNGAWIDDRRLQPQENAPLLPGQTLRLGPTLLLRRLEPILLEPTLSEAQTSWSAENATRIPPTAPPPIRPTQPRALLLLPETLQAAWKRVALNRGAAGLDGITLQEYAHNAEERLAHLQNLLRRGKYEPMPPRLFAAPKRAGGVRTIAILTIQDRIVQQALHAVLQPLLEPLFPPCSFAYRPGVSARDALRRVDSLLQQNLTWVAETDIAAFFDTISHKILLDRLSRILPDAFLLSLVTRCMAAGAVAAGTGLAQGAATSPLLSNLYLAEFDQHLLAQGWNLVRYGDDLVIPCPSRNKGQTALAEVEGFLRSRLQLALRPEKTALLPLQQGFTFLGFRFSETGRQPAPEAVEQLEERLRETTPEQHAAVQRGWTNYFGPPPTKSNNPLSHSTPHLSPTLSATQPGVFTIASPAPASPVVCPPDDEWIARFLQLFAGRAKIYARQSGISGSNKFVPCTGTLTPEHVRRHLAGEETLASYLLHTDGMVRTLVLDIDAVRNVGRPPLSETNSYNLEPVHAFARELYRFCRSLGLPVQWEDSGQKGRHLWLFFAEPTAPETARQLARLLAAHVGFPRAGVRLEVLPRHTEWPGPQLGDAVKLPFGVHPLTAKRCFFLDAEGDPIPDPVEALSRVRRVDAATVIAVIQQLTHPKQEQNMQQKQTATPKETAVNQLVRGCSVVRGLVERARTSGHLRHTHNLILLYTAGHLGKEGADFLHQTEAFCRNYDPNVCQSYIDRLEQNIPSVTCRRIREWLEEEGEAGLCTCSQACRTPLDHVGAPTEGALPMSSGKRPSTPNPKREAPQPTPAIEEQAWKGISEDLFQDPQEQEETQKQEEAQEQTP